MPDPPSSQTRPTPAGGADPRSAPASAGQAGGASGLSGMAGSGMAGRSSAGSGSGSGVAKLGKGAAGRQRFAADELAIVLSHYDLGTIEKIQEYPRGSRKAPKLILLSDSGLYLLKRRARGKNDKYKVAFCHGIQLHLAARQFPLPHLIGTRKDNNSMLRLGGHTYELFEYIKGTPYDLSLEATQDAGKILALLHKLIRDYQPKYETPVGSYHNSTSVHNAFKVLPQTIAKLSPSQTSAQAQRVSHINRALRDAYLGAVQQVEDAGLASWPKQIVHSDWHPGNMLFRGSRVVAVIDYDASRIHQRIIDAANGALQFSIIGGGDDTSSWPDYIDESRFKRFIRGYDSVPDNVLSRAELRVIPPLMIQALIAESVIPIAATGQFARMDGTSFLEMVGRKVAWLQQNTGELIKAAEG
ncbi:MAG: phosphotransferase enzyme family protein [Phycisphaerales bacterium JB063]